MKFNLFTWLLVAVAAFALFYFVDVPQYSFPPSYHPNIEQSDDACFIRVSYTNPKMYLSGASSSSRFQHSPRWTFQGKEYKLNMYHTDAKVIRCTVHGQPATCSGNPSTTYWKDGPRITTPNEGVIWGKASVTWEARKSGVECAEVPSPFDVKEEAVSNEPGDLSIIPVVEKFSVSSVFGVVRDRVFSFFDWLRSLF